jgi:hypothetical protein
MYWKGKTLVNFEDYLIYGVLNCDSREEAREFMLRYSRRTPTPPRISAT